LVNRSRLFLKKYSTNVNKKKEKNNMVKNTRKMPCCEEKITNNNSKNTALIGKSKVNK